MTANEELKVIVREKYSAIALQDKDTNAASCCGATSTSNKIYNIPKRISDWAAVCQRHLPTYRKVTR
jgi:hypothetical protein